MLRSKSLDHESYNSGDWFNRMKPRLSDPSFKPQKSHILAAVDNFLNLLLIRYSSRLFRLMAANAIQQRVRFHNTGPSWVPGVIVMSIEDGYKGVPGLSQLDPIYSYIVVVFNPCPTEVSFATPVLQARTFQLHPLQVIATDEVVKKSSYEPSVFHCACNDNIRVCRVPGNLITHTFRIITWKHTKLVAKLVKVYQIPPSSWVSPVMAFVIPIRRITGDFYRSRKAIMDEFVLEALSQPIPERCLE